MTTTPHPAGTVLVLGSINMDLTLRIGRLPVIGETLLGDDVHVSPGGKGANQAVAAALAGGRVRMAGRVGNDDHAALALAALGAAGVDTTRVETAAGRSTGLAVVMVDADGDNAIIATPGANQAIGTADVERLRDDIAAAEILLLQLEIPADAVARAVDIAAEAGTRVVLNLAPATALPSWTLGKVDVLVVNEAEAEFLLGRPLRTHDDLLTAAPELRGHGPVTVVLTAGAAGAVLADGAEVRHVPAQRVEVVDTAGAGDAFVGTLAARLAAGAPAREAVREATRAAAIAVGTPGAQLTAAGVL